MKLHPRALLPVLQSRLSRWPVTVLTGARQTGKTTLVRDLLPEEESGPPIYVSLDDPDERLRLAADPIRRLDHGSRLVILDEIQKQPGLLDSVKVLVDRGHGHRFLLLGSSQILLLHQVRETLAGRSTLLELWPLALVENVEGEIVPRSNLDLIWRQGEPALNKIEREPPSAEAGRLWRALADDQLLWGGYPRIEHLAKEDRAVWLRDFRRTYLERDLSDLGRVSDLDQFALAQNLFAARTGQILSYSEVSRELGVAVNTVKRYLRFLEISFQAYLLQPLQPSVSSRLIKAPKLYWTDTGLARLLSERRSLNDGPLFETAVLNELMKWLSWQPNPPSLNFFRTRAGLEVDFVVHSSRGLIAIEAKASERAHRQDARPITELMERIRLPVLEKNAFRLGVVVTRGREVERLAPGVWAVPFWLLFGPGE
ncbi:MAG: ATP-binding protein [Pseudomonadota bacterium]